MTPTSLPIQPRHLLPGLAAFAAAALVALLGLRASADGRRPAPAPRARAGRVTLRLLGVNDFHGHLEPPSAGHRRRCLAEGAPRRGQLPGRTIRVHAGDMVGASAADLELVPRRAVDRGGQRDRVRRRHARQPRVRRGRRELLRLLHGGQRTGRTRSSATSTARSSTPPRPTSPARVPYLAANTLDRDGTPLLPPYQIVERAGARVGFIGVTTTSTPTFVLPALRRPLPLHRHLRRGQPLGARAAAPGRRRDRRARPRGRAGQIATTRRGPTGDDRRRGARR